MKNKIDTEEITNKKSDAGLKKVDIKKKLSSEKKKIQIKSGIKIIKYKIYNINFSVFRMKPILDFIRFKNMFEVLGTLKTSKYSVQVSKKLYNFLHISTKHFLSINNLNFNEKNLKKLQLKTIYANKSVKQPLRVVFHGRGKIGYWKNNKSHIFCSIKILNDDKLKL